MRSGVRKKLPASADIITTEQRTGYVVHDKGWSAGPKKDMIAYCFPGFQVPNLHSCFFIVACAKSAADDSWIYQKGSGFIHIIRCFSLRSCAWSRKGKGVEA